MTRDGHIDLELLERYLLGKLDERESEVVRRHLQQCALCDLELKRLTRFAAIDSDDDLARSAEWIYARGKLERAFRERIEPAVTGGAVVRNIRSSRAARTARWLVPAAVMAAGLVLISYYAKRGEPQTPEPARRVMRGAPPIRYGIELVEPVGEIDAFPAVFRWRAERENNYYRLEIFTPTLSKIYQADNISGSSWTSPDALNAILKRDIIYLWSVKGFKGLERIETSPNGWFRIAHAPAANRAAP